MDGNRDVEPDGVEIATSLRQKYDRLCVKYAAVVRRLEARTERRFAIEHLGRWGMQTTAGALALVESGLIRLANRRFYELTVEGRWVIEGAAPQPPGAGQPLRTVVLEQAIELDRRGLRAANLRLREASDERILRLRLERAGKGGYGLLALIEDITEQERLEREMQRSHEALLQQERLHMLGEVAGAIAHDLRTTLRGMGLHLERLRREDGPSPAAAEAMRGLDECVRMASDAVAPLHDFARSGSLEVGAVRVERVARSAAALVEMEARTLGVPLHVQIRVPEGRPVRGSEAELSHLFLNLFNNARDAMSPKGGTVRVRARIENGAMCVVVADEGRGISPEHRARLFEPFFTTKGSRGTGLGLWLAANTVRRFGGSIRSRPQKRGAAFVLVLPLEDVSRSRGRRAAAPAGSPAPAARQRRPAPRSG